MVAFATAQAYYLDMNFMVSVRVLLVCKDVEVGLRANTGSEGLEKRVDGRNGDRDRNLQAPKRAPVSDMQRELLPE